MKRSEMREQTFYLTFEMLFNGDDIDDLVELYNDNVEEVCDYARESFAGICLHKNEFTDIINKLSKSWRVSRLPKVTVAILFVALYEIEYVDTVPDNVAINEAIELAKKFASKSDASYINGILGAYYRSKS